MGSQYIETQALSPDLPENFLTALSGREGD
jgi:hypothetical protein